MAPTKKRFIAFLLSVWLAVPGTRIWAQEVPTSSTSTTGIATDGSIKDIDSLLFDLGLVDPPEFCLNPELAKKHCTLAPELFKAGRTWENRANEQLIRADRLDLDAKSCERRWLGQPASTTPPPVESSGLPSLEAVLIVSGVVIAALAIGFSGGYIAAQ